MTSILTRLRRSPDLLSRAMAAHHDTVLTKRALSQANSLMLDAAEASFANNWHVAAALYVRAAKQYQVAGKEDWARAARLSADACWSMLHKPVLRQRAGFTVIAGGRA